VAAAAVAGTPVPTQSWDFLPSSLNQDGAPEHS
jgi:hypothetical protein